MKLNHRAAGIYFLGGSLTAMAAAWHLGGMWAVLLFLGVSLWALGLASGVQR